MGLLDAMSAFHIFVGVAVGAAATIGFLMCLALHHQMRHSLKKSAYEAYETKGGRGYHYALIGLAVAAAYTAWGVFKIVSGEGEVTEDIDLMGGRAVKIGFIFVHLLTAAALVTLAFFALAVTGWTVGGSDHAAVVAARKKHRRVTDAVYGSFGIVALYLAYTVIHLTVDISSRSSQANVPFPMAELAQFAY